MSGVEQSEEIHAAQCPIESHSESPSESDGESQANETIDAQTDAPEHMSVRPVFVAKCDKIVFCILIICMLMIQKKKRKKLERKARLVEKYKYQKVAAKERKKARKQQDNELLQKLKADGNSSSF
jgi:hypothetical protein